MKSIRISLLLSGLLLVMGDPATEAAWAWNPFAKAKPKADAPQPRPTEVSAELVKEPVAKLHAGKTPQGGKTMMMNGRKLSAPVSDKWRSGPPGVPPPSSATKALNNAVDRIPFMSVQSKVTGMPQSSQWSDKPPTLGSAKVAAQKPAPRRSFWGSMFKPKAAKDKRVSPTTR